jgi:hypothetical protein
VATTTIPTAPQRPAGRAALARIGAGIGAGFAAVIQFLSDLSSARACGAEAQRLMALSDAQLAKRGLKRDEIVTYAFRNFMRP